MDVERRPHPAAMPPDQEYMKGFEVEGSIPAKYRGEISSLRCIHDFHRERSLTRLAL